MKSITVTFTEQELDSLRDTYLHEDLPLPSYDEMLEVLKEDKQLLGMCVMYGCSDTEVGDYLCVKLRK
jgi:hypothetical protein